MRVGPPLYRVNILALGVRWFGSPVSLKLLRGRKCKQPLTPNEARHYVRKPYRSPQA